MRMNMQPKMLGGLLTLLSGLVLLAGCGGSSGGGGAAGGGGTAARAFGEIESLGSIVVNGVKYEVEAGLVVGRDNLAPTPGMVVAVEATLNAGGTTGTASAVGFDDNVKGPLTALTGDTSVAVGQVMGQTVIFEDNVTKFDPATGMPTGDDVDKVFLVSGFQDDSGKVYATFARELAGGGVLEVTGTVADLGASTFALNGLTVDYSTAVLRDLPAGGLADGLLVEVKGTVFVAATNTLTATEIEGKARGLGDSVAKVHIEGFVADLTATTFTINGQPVNYATATFRAGDGTDLANGIKVEAEGPLVNGVVRAVRITFKASVRIEAAVAAVNAGSGTLTFLGLEGITVRVHPELTRGAGALAGIAVNDEVKVRARPGASDLVATRLERIGEGADRTILRGPVTAIAGAVVTLLGTVDVDTSGMSDNSFQDHGTVIGRTTFFDELQVGDIVKARFRDGSWDEIEFED